MPSLGLLMLALFADGATTGAFTTVLLLKYAHGHEPWVVALLGAVASALGSAVQMVAFRWMLRADRPWLQRFLPTRESITRALARFPSASFLLLVLARATPLPDAPIKLVAALAGYPIPLYILALLLGALPYYFVLALIGHRFELPGWVLWAGVVVIVAGLVVDRVRSARATR